MAELALSGQSWADEIREAISAAGWPSSSLKVADNWCVVEHPSASTPSQGWKLHVGATIVNAREVLSRTLPVLLSQPLSFKVCSSVDVLGWLNAANGGISQIGKFVTVYPANNGEARVLAERLADATCGLVGPRVRSDSPLRDGCIVSYRYGEFTRRDGYDETGRRAMYLEAPDGSRLPDRRDRFRVPQWETVPFANHGAVVRNERPKAIEHRYVLFDRIHESPRGEVYRAVDVHLGEPCIVKLAHPGDAVSTVQSNAMSELLLEATMLRRLGGRAGAPAWLAFVDAGDEAALVMEDVSGRTLREAVKDDVLSAGYGDVGRGLRLARMIAVNLSALHQVGIAHRDVHPGNVIVDGSGRARLIDFGSARDIGLPLRQPGFGMRGYASAQQLAGLPPAVSDDVHAFGALLYFAVTGDDLLAREQLRLRGPGALNPRVQPAVHHIVAKCVAVDPDDRFTSMSDVVSAIDSAATYAGPAPEFGAIPEPQIGREVAHFLERFCGTLDASTHRRGDRSTWPSTSGIWIDPGSPWLYEGDAGIVYALTHLLDDVPAATALLERGARDLMAHSGDVPSEFDGLFIGRSGIGLALLRASCVLDDQEMLAHARMIGRDVSKRPPRNPDLLHGAAGRIRFQLALAFDGGDADGIARAVEDGHWLCESVDRSSGFSQWRIPEPWGEYSAVGYAHGSAGIADVLLDLWQATGDRRFLSAAEAVADDLSRLVTPAFEDGTGAHWPVYFNEVGPPIAAWCHGAGGIGSFYLHCQALGLRDDAQAIAERAGWTVARGRRTDETSYCHGLAGHAQFLSDLHAATGDARWRTEGTSVASLLVQSSTHLIGEAERETIGAGVRLGLMTGMAGVALGVTGYLRVGIRAAAHHPSIYATKGDAHR
jgi:serine/threonine protein kinase